MKRVVGTSAAGAGIGGVLVWAWNGFLPQYPPMTAEVAAVLAGGVPVSR